MFVHCNVFMKSLNSHINVCLRMTRHDAKSVSLIFFLEVGNYVLGFSMAMADKEIGSVLIAINSYVNPRTHLEPLLNIDQAFADYIEAFYSCLFFHVEVLVDFSYKDLEEKLKSLLKIPLGVVLLLCSSAMVVST